MISYLHKHPDGDNSHKDASAPSHSAPGHGYLNANGANLSSTFERNQLIISRTSAVNLLTIPTHWTREMKIIVQEASLNPDQCQPTVLLVAKLELAFLLSKESLSDWVDRAFLQTVINDEKDFWQETQPLLSLPPFPGSSRADLPSGAPSPRPGGQHLHRSSGCFLGNQTWGLLAVTYCMF